MSASFCFRKTVSASCVLLGPWHWLDPDQHFSFSHACPFPFNWNPSLVPQVSQGAEKGLSPVLEYNGHSTAFFNPRFWELGRTLTIPSDSPWAREKSMQNRSPTIARSLTVMETQNISSVGGQDFIPCLSNGCPASVAGIKEAHVYYGAFLEGSTLVPHSLISEQ